MYGEKYEPGRWRCSGVRSRGWYGSWIMMGSCTRDRPPWGRCKRSGGWRWIGVRGGSGRGGGGTFTVGGGTNGSGVRTGSSSGTGSGGSGVGDRIITGGGCRIGGGLGEVRLTIIGAGRSGLGVRLRERRRGVELRLRSLELDPDGVGRWYGIGRFRALKS